MMQWLGHEIYTAHVLQLPPIRLWSCKCAAMSALIGHIAVIHTTKVRT